MIFVRLLQLLAALLAIRFLARALGRFAQRRPPARRRPAVLTGDLVRDRICNTHVPKQHAIVARIAGHDEHFCSAACRDEALRLAKRAS
jgi:hypothetical protein